MSRANQRLVMTEYHGPTCEGVCKQITNTEFVLGQVTVRRKGVV